jgi:hypothetical protein
MQPIQAVISPLPLNPAHRRALGAVCTGVSKTLLLPIPIVALVFGTLVAWLEP